MPKKAGETEPAATNPAGQKTSQQTTTPAGRTQPAATSAIPTDGPPSHAGARSTASGAGAGDDRGATRVREQVADASSEVAKEVKERAAGVAQRARSGVERLAEEQRQRASQRLSSTASSLRSVADQSEDRWLGQTSSAAADRIDRLASHLDQRDVRALVGEAEELARERPTLFLGSMFVAGTMLGRFLRSSPEHPTYGSYDGPVASPSSTMRTPAASAPRATDTTGTGLP